MLKELMLFRRFRRSIFYKTKSNKEWIEGLTWHWERGRGRRR